MKHGLYAIDVTRLAVSAEAMVYGGVVVVMKKKNTLGMTAIQTILLSHSATLLILPVLPVQKLQDSSKVVF
jgi:hypothetical protein